MNYLYAVIPLFLSVILTQALLPVFRRQFEDVPNHRSMHVNVTPRGGGIIFVGVIIVGLLVFSIVNTVPMYGFIGALAAVYIIGAVDDQKSLSPAIRLLIHFSAAGAVIFIYGPLDFGVLFNTPKTIDIGLSFLWIIAVLNIYNFLDGIDGYAGLMGLVAAILSIIVFQQDLFIIYACFIVMGAVVGFLRYNWNPAKIFMGDAGSVSLGFFFACLPFLSEVNPTGWIEMMLLLYIFLVDGIFTLFRRLLNKEKIWKAHRSHIYQLVVAKTGNVKGYLLIAFAVQLLVILGMFVFTLSKFDYMIVCYLIGFVVCLVLYKRFRIF